APKRCALRRRGREHPGRRPRRHSLAGRAGRALRRRRGAEGGDRQEVVQVVASSHARRIVLPETDRINATSARPVHSASREGDSMLRCFFPLQTVLLRAPRLPSPLLLLLLGLAAARPATAVDADVWQPLGPSGG